MNKNIILWALAILVSIAVVGCSGKTSSGTDESESVVTVDSILANPEAYVGQTVTIEGVVSHLCKHGGRKAFLLGSDENTMIRCDATAEMGNVFPQETIHQPLRVTGVVMESRLDEETIRGLEQDRQGQMERVAEQQGEEEAAKMQDIPTGCETERKAAGQTDVESFAAQMADYRRRIAERDSLEGKPYLSTYYIQASAYEILPR